MKKTIAILGICGIATLAGCQNDTQKESIYEENGQTINVNNKRTKINNQDLNVNNKNYGYTRHQKAKIMQRNDLMSQYAAIDREQISDIIGKNAALLPHVDDVSTFVTDEEVLVIYQTDSNNRSKTADQVKRTAMSVVPRWYHVYVSDNTNLRKTIESYSQMDSNNRNFQSGINRIIHEMKKSPQGKIIYYNENTNGEAKNERMPR